MIIHRRRLLAGLAAAPALAALPRLAFAREAGAQDMATQADAALDATFAQHAPPAMISAVVGREGVVWSGVRGLRRTGQPDAATTGDLWHLGSNGKAMTAALYARLVEQGRARWDAPLSSLFPDLRLDPGYAEATIDDLLRHRAGIDDRQAVTREVLIAAHQDQRPIREQRTAFAADVLGKAPTGPRGAFAYSNAGYALAGAAIERITDQPWEDAIRTHLFTPMRVTSVGFGAPLGDNPWGHRAMGETLVAVDPARGADNPPLLGPAGRMHMTLADYARFLRLYLNDGDGQLSPATTARLMTPPEGAPPPYAYGWGTSTPPWARGQALAHEGSNTMWHAIAIVAPARGLAVVSIANDRVKGGPANQAMARALTGIFAS